MGKRTVPAFFQSLLAAGTLLSIALTSPVHAEDKFRVCADPNNPPFSDKNGSGFENRIAEMFAQELGQTVEYTWFPQRIGFIRNTLKAKLPDKDDYKCDIVMGVPAGYELVATTDPYYHSVYALVYPRNQGWDDIQQPEDILALAPERRGKLRIAMFDRGPATAWLVQNGLVKQGVPYQSMTGDPSINTAQTIAKDIKEGVIDMAILWGPMAAFVASSNGENGYTMIPMHSTAGMKFDFSIAMGVRHGDKERKNQLNQLIQDKAEAIRTLLTDHGVPLIQD